ncbi:hypothetical protein JXC34_04070, partial [Candidatus Woesearchaeota archaeon]|nr:hypothetical protein [Candidatus Woesearchaeota archaeon]
MPHPMVLAVPPRVWHFGPPIEEVLIELVYFFLILGISGYIYLKTKEIYDLTKHRGIYHFRNIFFYFGMAYLFRLFLIFLMFSGDLFNYVSPRTLSPISFIFVSYFSTMAIFSVLFSIIDRFVKADTSLLNTVLHTTAMILSIFVGVTSSNYVLMLIQTSIFIFALIAILFKSKKEKQSKLLSHNRITFVLLFVFWVINSLGFTRRFIPREIKIPLYLISAGVF